MRPSAQLCSEPKANELTATTLTSLCEAGVMLTMFTSLSVVF